jgi:hypothetical protein
LCPGTGQHDVRAVRAVNSRLITVWFH